MGVEQRIEPCDLRCMTTTTSSENLGRDIEKLVRQHIAATHKTAEEALTRAFASAARAPARGPRVAKARKEGKRRAPEEVAALGERLYEAVCAKPGEGMVVLAADVGASVRDLHRPMTLLKRASRVRSVGERHRTRYFPMANEVAKSA